MTKKYALGLKYADAYWHEGNRKKLQWIPDAEEIWDMEQFRSDPRPKILMVDCFNPGGDFPCKGDYSWADLIIAVTSEFLGDQFDTILSKARQSLNNQNVIFIVGGKVKTDNSDRVYHPLVCWISHVFDNNDYTPIPLSEHKPYLFDALLGQNRESRLYVFYKLLEDDLLDKNLVSMFRRGKHHYVNFTKPDLDEMLYNEMLNDPVCGDLVLKHGMVSYYRSSALDELELPDVNWPKNDPINYSPAQPTSRYCRSRPKVILDIGMDMPTKIFDASWYSIVAETKYTGNDVFITEKIGKRFVAKRVFVLFGARGCLAYLRSQGFQTFDNIIDESYDDVLNDRKRFDMAWEQVKLLSTLDPLDVYRRAEPALENNYNLLPTLENEHLKIRDFIAQFLPK